MFRECSKACYPSNLWHINNARSLLSPNDFSSGRDSERWKPKFILPLQNSIYFWFSHWIMTQRLPLFSAPTHTLPVFANPCRKGSYLWIFLSFIIIIILKWQQIPTNLKSFMFSVKGKYGRKWVLFPLPPDLWTTTSSPLKRSTPHLISPRCIGTALQKGKGKKK